MKRFVRDLLGLSFGVFVLACSGGGDLEQRIPLPGPGDGKPGDGEPVRWGLCESPAAAVLEASETLVLSGTFERKGRTVDPCIGDAPAMAFVVAVPDDGTLEVQARASFPVSISVREDCETPGETTLCNADVGKKSALQPVSGVKEVFVTVSSLAADSVGKNFEISLDFHPLRKSGESCDPGFLCEPGTFCRGNGAGVCADFLQVSDAQVVHDGAEGNERILSFGVKGPMTYAVSYELQITDADGRTEIIHDGHLIRDENEQESVFLRQALRWLPVDLGVPHSARLRASNGAWTDWVEVEVVDQPLRQERQACDPHAGFDRCGVGLACAGSEESAICLPTDEARIAQFERAPQVELQGRLAQADALRVTSTGRGVWEIPSSCEEALFVPPSSIGSLPEAVVRLSVGEGGATVGLMPNADVFMLFRNEGGHFEAINCGLGYAFSGDLVLEEGEYAAVLQSAEKRLAPAWDFGLSFFPPRP